MHKIYAFNNGGSPGFMSAIAIGDDGKIVGQHCCSHEVFMQHDLGVIGNWKHDGYDAAYGAGNWSIEWVSSDHIDGHAALQAAFELNKAQPPIPEEERPGVTVVTVDASGKEHTHRATA